MTTIIHTVKLAADAQKAIADAQTVQKHKRTSPARKAKRPSKSVVPQ